MNPQARVVHCPENDGHYQGKKVILLLLQDENLFVRCPKHHFVKIEFFKGEEKLSFKDVSVIVSPTQEGTQFDLDNMPVLAIGEFPK